MELDLIFLWPWDKNEPRIKIHQTRDKKDNVPHATIIWKCLANCWSENVRNFFEKKEKLLRSNFFLEILEKFPVKRSEYSDNTSLFSLKKPEVFHGWNAKEWNEGGGKKGFFRRRISNSISNPRKCTFRGIWRRLRRVNRYVSTIYLHTSATSRARHERKVLFLHLCGEKFGPEPWNNNFPILRSRKITEKNFSEVETNEDESWIFRYLQQFNWT